MSRVVISGAGGMIGLALIRHLIEGDNQVIALVRKNSKSAKKFPISEKIKTIECSLSDYRDFNVEDEADVFIHLAWDKTTVSGREDVEVQYKNIGYSLDAVNLANRFKCKVFIGAGSQAEYGLVDQKLNEKVPCNPLSGYGIAKYTAGRLTNKLCSQLGIRHSWARILSVFGANDGENSLIMYLIKTFLSNDTAMLTPCNQIWDYMYCDDIASALVAIAQRGKDGRVYCLGSGQARQLRDYVLDVREVANSKSKIEFSAKPYYPHQPMYLSADINDLILDTGFSVKTTFKEGIKKTIAWWEEECKEKK